LNNAILIEILDLLETMNNRIGGCEMDSEGRGYEDAMRCCEHINQLRAKLADQA